MVFRKQGLKCRWGGSRPKFLVCPSFFIESLSKKNFEVGDPKNRRFWAFFQKSMSEISANWEKTCFSCCRFFRKIEEMGGYFWGCALKSFFQLCTNVESFQKKFLGLVANSWSYNAFLVFLFVFFFFRVRYPPTFY